MLIPKLAPTKSRSYRSYKCAVPGCKSNSCDNLDVSFHRLPAANKRVVCTTDDFGNSVQMDQLTAWTRVLKVEEKLSHRMNICSLHFRREDYSLPDLPTQKPRLLKTAIPSVNLPDENESKIENNEKGLQSRSATEDEQSIVSSKTSPVNCSAATDAQESGTNEDKNVSAHDPCNRTNSEEEDDYHQPQKLVKGNESCSVGEHISTGEPPDNLFVHPAMAEDEASSDSHMAVVDDQVKAGRSAVVNEGAQMSDNEPLCGCGTVLDHSYSLATPNDDVESEPPRILDDSESPSIMPDDTDDLMQPDSTPLTQQDITKSAPIMKRRRLLDTITSDKKLSTACGIESFELFNAIVKCVKFATSDKWEKDGLMMNTEDRVLMVYSKLKQNLSYSYLAILFELSERHCTRMFIETLEVLSECLKCAIPWPSKETILSNLPQCFEKFENTRIVVDCTEVFVECPSKTCCRIHLFSYYKGSYTIKVMIGVAPDGTITFISKAYGGRWSDSAIFEQSDLIKRLDSGDAVMVDKGFLIDEICHRNKIHLIRPSFKRSKQFSEKDASINNDISTARVHVERVNQRIKVFQILGETFPVSLLPHFEKILLVICGTVNLSSPILKDDKFMKNE